MKNVKETQSLDPRESVQFLLVALSYSTERELMPVHVSL